MNIIMLVQNFDSMGGTETQTALIAKHMARKNNVTIITRSSPGRPVKEKRDCYAIIRKKCPQIPLIGSILFYVFLLIELLKRKRETDIVISMMTVNDISAILAKLVGMKVIVWVRGEYEYMAKGLVKRIVFTLSMKSDVVISQTEITKRNIIRNHSVNKIEVIPNMIESVHKRSRGKEILYVGRLIKIKGVRYLIKAIKTIKSSSRVLIVGDGTEKERLKKEAKSLNVVFKGMIDHDAVGEFFSRAYVLVLPSLSEGFPNVILEAMSYGVPVIATRVGGIPEIVKQGVNGFVVEPKNPEEIAKYLETLLNDKSLREELSKNSIKEAKKYMAENIIKKLEEVCRSV